MEKEIALLGIRDLSKQRNLFLILTIMLGASCCFLSFKILQSEERVILTPSLSQEVWVSNSGVSKSYLEETTLMYLPLLLDLSSEVIGYKAGVIFKYVSQSDPNYMQKLQQYFSSAKEQYSQFDLSTYFSVKNLEVDSKNLSVIANGTLASRYGQEGYAASPASYLVSYEWVGGHLRLKEFVKLEEQKK